MSRPDSVPALDFEELAAKVKEQEEEEKAAEEEAKRLANLPLPAGWETAVVRDHSVHASSFCATKHGGISADGERVLCVAVALDRADVLCQHADGGDAVRAPDRPGGGLDRVSVPPRALGLKLCALHRRLIESQ